MTRFPAAVTLLTDMMLLFPAGFTLVKESGSGGVGRKNNESGEKIRGKKLAVAGSEF